MRHWSLLGIANYWLKPGRTLGVVLAVALGSGTVLWIHNVYESLRRSIEDQVRSWIGRSDIQIEPAAGGLADESLLAGLGELPNVKVVCPRTKDEVFAAAAGAADDEQRTWVRIDLVGIDPASEYHLRDYRTASGGTLTDRPADSAGRRLLAGDRQRCMIEDDLAVQLQLEVGDTVEVAPYPGEPGARFEIAGRFFQRRVAKFQEPVLVTLLDEAQAVTGRAGQVRLIDLIVEDDAGPALRATVRDVRELAERRDLPLAVESAESRLRPINNAREQTEFVLALVSTIALVTAFFIVATTVNMGVVERLRQLGLLRCVGMTRPQLAALWFIEVLPLGVLGAMAGIPLGFGLTLLSVWLVPEYFDEPAMSTRGLIMATFGGIATALISGSFPALRALQISPLDAARPQTRALRRRWEIVAALAGAGLIAGHEFGLHRLPAYLWFYPSVSATGTFALLLGYALPVPLAVRTLGRPLSAVAAAILQVRRQILHDQLIRSPWRSATVCFGFMVALSLVVSVSVHGESIISGWDFPKQVPETFVWTMRPVPMEALHEIRELDGVKNATALTALLVHAKPASPGEGRGSPLSKVPFLSLPTSMFVALEVDTFLDLVELEFLEGDPDTARAELAAGGAVLLPEEAARQFGVRTGAELSVTFHRRESNFRVAGVVKSPALDVAARYFQADQQLVKASSSTLLGSMDDAEARFGVHDLTLVLASLELPPPSSPQPPPLFTGDGVADPITPLQMAEWLPQWADQLPEHRTLLAALLPEAGAWRDALQAEAGGAQPDSAAAAAAPPHELLPFTRALREARNNWSELSPAQRFERFREQIILQQIKEITGTPEAMTGSIRQLKEDIDRDLRHAMRLVTSIPTVGLLVAAIGAANLMMASVASRRRQIAITRAVGATRWQILRSVLAEALILGLLGSLLGLIMGLHAAHNVNILTLRVWGFLPQWTVPWGTLAVAVGVTLATCLAAGLPPARRAARSSIIEAMV